MEFLGYFTIIQRPAEHLKELEIMQTEDRRLKGKEKHLMVVFSVSVLQEGKSEENSLLV